MINMCPSQPGPLSLVIAVAEEDKIFAEALKNHLQSLSDSGQLACWFLLDISPGEERAQVIEEQCQQADLFLMLLSVDFFFSSDCEQIVEHAREREGEGLARIFSIMLRAVDLEESPFQGRELLPCNQEPIELWSSPDEAWVEIINQICTLMQIRRGVPLGRPLPCIHLQTIHKGDPGVRPYGFAPLNATWDNPYKGLRAFQSKDAGNFFGREDLIDELFTTLKNILERDEARLLAVIGPSGVGKSSVVLAGLLPRLKTGHMAGSEHWVIKPGDNPLEALLTPLAHHLLEVEINKILHDLKTGDENILHEYTQRIAVKLSAPRVVLVIDQIEELFLPGISADVRSRFLSLVSTAVRTPHGPLLVVLTLRADFLHHVAGFPEFYKMVLDHRYIVSQMSIDKIREAIEKSAANRVQFDEHLVGDMLQGLQGQSGALLPMVQLVLKQLFEAREGHRLTQKAYKEIGGIEGTVKKQAEKTYKRLPDERHRWWVQIIFLHLVTIGSNDPNLFSEEPSSGGPVPVNTSNIPVFTGTGELIPVSTGNKGVRAAVQGERHFFAPVKASRLLRYFRIRIPGNRTDRVETPLVNASWYEQNVIRKRESQTDLIDMADLSEQPIVQRCIDALVAARLLTASDVEEVAPATSVVTHIPTIGVSHEMVLREWPRLKDWISASHSDLRSLQTMDINVDQWKQQPETTSSLYHGKRLKEMEVLAERLPLTKRQQEFLQASQASRRKEERVFRRNVLLGFLVIAIIGASIGGFQWWRATHPPDPNHVTNTQDDGQGSLRWCLANAQAGSTIIIDPTLRGIITLKDTLTVGNPLTVIGPGENALALRSQEMGLGIDATGTVSISNLSFTQGSPSSAAFGSTTIDILKGSTLYLNHVTIAHNHKVGIQNGGTLTIANSTISDNSPSGLSGPGPGGIYNTGKMSIINSTLTGNSSSPNGSSVGGVINYGEVTITNSIITGNASSPRNFAGVGGVYNEGTIAITNSTISNNFAFSAANGSGVGGVLNHIGHMTISNSTISGNSSSGAGSINVGGVANDIGTMTIANSTISHNSSSNIAGIDTGAGGSTTLVFCTIAENTRLGIFVHSITKDKPSSMMVQNTLLLSTPIVIADSYSIFQSNGYNLADTVNASFFGQTGDRIIQDPSTLFEHGDLLAQNGGATQTIQIRVGSEAYDAIPVQACHMQAIFDAQNHIYTDQRDQLRPGKGKVQCDIGAYEAQQ